MKRDLKDILNDAKVEAFNTLACGYYINDMAFMKEASKVHSSLCFKYYEVVKDEINERLQRYQRDLI